MSTIVYSCNSTKSSDSIHEQTCCQDIATVCISNSQYLGFGGPWLSAVSALVKYRILTWDEQVQLFSYRSRMNELNTTLEVKMYASVEAD